MLHPNAAPSEFSQMRTGPKAEQKPAKELGWFKRLMVAIDAKVLKPFLVVHKLEDCNLVDAVDDVLEELQSEMDQHSDDPRAYEIKSKLWRQTIDKNFIDNVIKSGNLSKGTSYIEVRQALLSQNSFAGA